MKDGKRRLYYRLTWREGEKRREKFVLLPEDEDSRKFDKAYWEIRSGKSPVLTPAAKETWAELIATYRAHPKFTKLTPRTRKSYLDIPDQIQAANGSKSVAANTRAVHLKHAATPRKADRMIQILSILFNFARKTLDWKVENPAEGIELYGSQREFEPWPEWMISKATDAPEVVRSINKLILGTGQRPNAAVMMRRDQFQW